ncbi:Late competence development protein ComFB [Alteromonadaceae bacterium Bs31]|nr:Late competence development protein ComFB [Alteromonadaceae bacterium Bs31]
MLLGAGRHRHDIASAQDSVHNYYEHLVIAQLKRASERALNDMEFMADVSCVALNRLPPRYVRHDVDMTFFLSPTEMDEMDDKVAHAVKDALEYVESREQKTDADEE